MNFYEIPLTPEPQQFAIPLAGANYTITLEYHNDPELGWTLDLADASGTNMLTGVPLVTGADLLAQYQYLGIGGSLYVYTDSDPLAVPTPDNLGIDAHLYFATP